MMSYILTAAFSLAAGVVLTLMYQSSVRRAVSKATSEQRRQYNLLADENDALRGRVITLLRCRDSRDSYRQGVEDGVQKGRNMTNLEVLEGTLSGRSGSRKVQVGSKNS